MRVEAKRIYLRKLRDEDCTEAYLSWLLDPEVNQYLETRHVRQTLDSVREYVRAVNARSNEHLFGIFLQPDDRHIGNIKVGPIGRYHPVADVSLLIGARDCWGKGYATEAIAAISRYAFDVLGVRKLAAGMYASNQGSVRAFLKVGYRQEGLRRRHAVLNGELVDVVECGLIPEDFSGQES